MPRSIKDAYTDKQKRKAEQIEESYEKRGLSTQQAELRSWATAKFEDYQRIRAVLNPKRSFGYRGL